MTRDEHERHIQHYDDVLAAEDIVFESLRQAAREGMPEAWIDPAVRKYHLTLEASPHLGQMVLPGMYDL